MTHDYKERVELKLPLPFILIPLTLKLYYKLDERFEAINKLELED
jgi:hypothetical protein